MYRYKKKKFVTGGSNRKVPIDSYPLPPCPPAPLPPKSFKITNYYYPPDNGKSKQKLLEKPLILAVLGKSLTSLLN